ncbi:hypothetical protein [Aureimonas jatrophae]|uniref:Uncharacterized protein n=1 Tax=Aureimonas jatrophae TaxID=1166073 RepID=A0A1H0N551_9HYPH|nr:hypothetical protein [Aureimonas jatrophae]MBB3953036.1 hypothetical protein [Aureimonas jatrophae]SDO87625.1 hypothetical protein SAMN05192530_11728 [Aureimonas jatrophae]
MSPTADDWTIEPGQGLGRLRFGIAPAAVEALSQIYGSATSRMEDRISDSILQDTIAELGDSLTEEEKRDLLQVYAEQGPDNSSVTEVRDDGGLVLRYEHDRLVELTVLARRTEVRIGEVLVFSDDVPAVLQAAEAINRAPGLYSGTAAAFPHAKLMIEGFTERTTVDPVVMSRRDERYAQRSLSMFETIDTSGDFVPFTWRKD